MPKIRATAAFTGTVINVSPRPRMLIKGFEDREELVAKIKDLVPTSRLIENLHDVRQREWDLLVTDQPFGSFRNGLHARLADHICAIYVSPGETIGTVIESVSQVSTAVESRNGHFSQELFRINGLPDRIATLAHEQLEPVLKSRESHQYYMARSTLTHGTAKIELHPFVATAAGRMLAGKYVRSSTSEAWLLPHDVPDPALWVAAALAEWHKLAPDSFPGVPDWTENSSWMTAGERAASRTISDFLNEKDRVLRELELQENVLREKRREVRESADRYERALLTAQSNELQVAVMRALKEIGFIVTDSDIDAKTGEYLEDLQIEDPDSPGWLALGEVKGYTKGAKTEALTQFIRFNARFMQSHGRVPDNSWYIVNQFLARDPSSRPQVLNGRDEDVTAFATGGGLIIDTTVLFTLLLQVQESRISREDARMLIRGSVGRLVLPQQGG